MEDNKTGLQRALENAAIKAGWGILVTAMALPTAWQWATTLDQDRKSTRLNSSHRT